MTRLTQTNIPKYIINNTGAASEKGRLVEADTTNNQAILTDVDSNHCIGVIDEAGIPNGGTMRIIIGGETEVLLDDNTGSTAGDWAGTSEAGYAEASINPPAAPTHFKEIGHFIETVAATGAGTHVMAKIIMHFN